MAVLLTAIWPSFAKIPNHIPAGEGITTSGMCAFLLYFLLQLPFLCIPYTKVQYFFALKSFIAPIVFLGIFGDTLHKAGGTISQSTVITQGNTIGGSALAWAFFASKSCSVLPSSLVPSNGRASCRSEWSIGELRHSWPEHRRLFEICE